MTDLISRQEALDALAKFVPYAICDESTESYTNGLTDAYNLICQLPSAPQEKTAEWVPSTKYKGFLTCSACEDFYIEGWSDNERKWRYCPMCGAIMNEVGE